MPTNDLYLLRGVSGSGKTTAAAHLCSKTDDGVLIGEDDWFYVDGEYDFEMSELDRAFYDALSRVEEAMSVEQNPIFVHGVFVEGWHLNILASLCEEWGYNFHSLVVENRHGNSSVHDVPTEDTQRQYHAINNSLKLLP